MPFNKNKLCYFLLCIRDKNVVLLTSVQINVPNKVETLGQSGTLVIFKCENVRTIWCFAYIVFIFNRKCSKTLVFIETTVAKQ